MSFPWMTNTQIQQSTGLTAYKDHTPHMRSQPTKPTSRCGIHDARGSRRWDEWNRQKSGGMSKIEGGSTFTMAAPTSTAESRLLPAGRNKLLPVGNVNVDPKITQGEYHTGKMKIQYYARRKDRQTVALTSRRLFPPVSGYMAASHCQRTTRRCYRSPDTIL